MPDHDTQSKEAAPSTEPPKRSEPTLVQAVPEAAPTAPTSRNVLTVTPEGKRLEFASIVGQPTVPMKIKITNPTSRPINIRPSLEGSDASEFGHNGHVLMMANPQMGTEGMLEIDIHYKPSAAGQHIGVLVIRHEGGGRYPVVLTGTALATSNAPAYQGGPDAMTVHDLKDSPAKANKGRLADAADALAQVPRAFNRLSSANDVAHDQFASKIRQAAASLTGRITAWIAQEGIAGVQSFKENPGNALLRFIREKALESGLELVGPSGKLAAMIIEIAVDMYDTTQTNNQANEQSAKLGRASRIAINSVDEVTRVFMDIYANAKGQYATTRALCAQVASEQVTEKLIDIDAAMKQSKPADDVVAGAAKLIDKYQARQTEYSEAFKGIAGAGLTAQNVADRALAKVLDQYLVYRATGTLSPEDDKKKVAGDGWINFEVARSKSPNTLSVGYTAKFGSYVPESDTMAKHIADKSFWREAGWNVHLVLRSAQGSGHVHLKQDAAGNRTLTATGDAANLVQRVGEDAIWDEVVRHR